MEQGSKDVKEQLYLNLSNKTFVKLENIEHRENVISLNNWKNQKKEIAHREIWNSIIDEANKITW
jgi:hypothetical protein